MIKQETRHGLVPPEQHGIRDHNFLVVFFTKTFFNDIMRQKFLSAVEVSFTRIIDTIGSFKTIGLCRGRPLECLCALQYV